MAFPWQQAVPWRNLPSVGGSLPGGSLGFSHVSPTCKLLLPSPSSHSPPPLLRYLLSVCTSAAHKAACCLLLLVHPSYTSFLTFQSCWVTSLLAPSLFHFFLSNLISLLFFCFLLFLTPHLLFVHALIPPSFSLFLSLACSLICCLWPPLLMANNLLMLRRTVTLPTASNMLQEQRCVMKTDGGIVVKSTGHPLWRGKTPFYAVLLPPRLCRTRL